MPAKRACEVVVLPSARRIDCRRVAGIHRTASCSGCAAGAQDVARGCACQQPCAVMSKKSPTNAPCGAANGQLTVLSAASADGPTPHASSSASTQFEIPLPPLKPAAVAAPEAGRSPASGHTVLIAEAAPTKRNAARLCRDRISRSRAHSPKKHRKAVATRDVRSAVPPEIAAPGAGETVSHADCLAIVHAPAVAASDDVHGNTAAGTEPMGTGCAGRSLRDRQKNRKACADAALTRPEKNQMGKNKPNEPTEQAAAELAALKVPTDPEALLDGPAYVRSVAQHVDLVGASARLVVSTDEKVSKRWTGTPGRAVANRLGRISTAGTRAKKNRRQLRRINVDNHQRKCAVHRRNYADCWSRIRRGWRGVEFASLAGRRSVGRRGSGVLRRKEIARAVA